MLGKSYRVGRNTNPQIIPTRYISKNYGVGIATLFHNHKETKQSLNLKIQHYLKTNYKIYLLSGLKKKSGKPKCSFPFLQTLARLKGVEPPTYGSEVRRSVQLSYRRTRDYWYYTFTEEKKQPALVFSFTTRVNMYRDFRISQLFLNSVLDLQRNLVSFSGSQIFLHLDVERDNFLMLIIVN